jgi:hypothetical protein
MVTVTEVGSDFVVVSPGHKFYLKLYLWEKVKSRVGTLPDASIFEDWCSRVNALERLAIETE